MNITKTITETVERLVIEKTICDKCGIEIMREDWYRHDVTFMAEWGNHYPEGGWGEGLKIEHLCKECVHNAFMILRENGFTVKEYEWNW